MIDNKKEFREIRRTIGQNMYNFRQRKRMTLGKLSQLAHISINVLDQYEMGKNQMALSSLMSIAKSLEVSMHDFFTEQRPIAAPNNFQAIYQTTIVG